MAQHVDTVHKAATKACPTCFQILCIMMQDDTHPGFRRRLHLFCNLSM